MTSTKTQAKPIGWIVAAAAAAAAAIFLLDVVVPPGIAVPMFYVLPILLTRYLPGWRSTVFLTGGVVLLSWVGLIPYFDEVTPVIVGNRTLTPFLLLIVAGLVLKQKLLAQQRAADQMALRESEERFAKVFRTSPNPIGITEAATGRCLEVNEACLQLFGFSREEVIGNTTLMLGIWPNHEERARLVERLKAGAPVRNLELSFKTKSGDLRHILVSSDLAELSGMLCLITVGNDITDRKRAEEALRESEERLLLALESANMGTWQWDAETDLLRWNERQFELFGIRTEDFLDTGADALSRIHSEDRPRIQAAVRRVLEEGATVREEFRVVHADGSVHWLFGSGRPLWDDHGRCRYVVGVNLDITDRRRAQEEMQGLNEVLEARVRERTAALAEANERWGWVVRATTDGVWDWDLVRDTAYFSPRWKEMHGFQEHDSLESTSDWQMRIHPEDRPSVLASLEAYLRGEKEAFWEEYRIQRKDGASIWVLDRGIAIFNEQGLAVRMVGAETDITWRKEAEHILRRREHEFHTLAENVPALFSYIDRDRKYRFVNKRYEELFNRPDEELIGMSVEDLLGSDGNLQVPSLLEKALAGEIVAFECELKLAGDGLHYLAGQYVPDRDEQGQVAGVFALMTDVTALKATEALLREREAQLRDLGAKLLQAQEEERRRISRDLHDDVMQRMGGLTLDLYGLAASVPSQDAEFLQSQIKACGASAEQLTTDLQRMAHQLHPSVLEFGGLEAAVREHVDDFAARTGVSAELITRNVPQDVPLAQATCLYRVLQEGLQNVQKHADATAVLVRLLRTGRGLGLCIHDDGRGIEQVEGAARRKGLGLTSMAERVGMLNGVFHILTKPDDGTEIHAWVPLEDLKRES